MSDCKNCKSKEVRTKMKGLFDELFVGEKIKNERLAICYACDKFIGPSGQCGECGCYIFAKTATKGESCPLPEPKW